MNAEREKFISKFLSYVLRHKPEAIDLTLDDQGWADVGFLLVKAEKKGKKITMEELAYVVANNAKQRFSFNEDQTKIRANQGHSIQVDLALQPVVPPSLLYHGTVAKFLDSIKENGLQKMNRQHVHLSPDIETALNVGSRRGKPLILTIHAKEMHDAGYLFYLSKNGVWLTDQVPARFIKVEVEVVIIKKTS